MELIDLRNRRAFGYSHLMNAVNFPFEELEARLLLHDLAAVSSHEQYVLAEMRLQGYSIAEAAKAQGLSEKRVRSLLKEMFAFIRDFTGDVPGAAARDCGNYLDMNLPMANYWGKRFLEEVLEKIGAERMYYPE